MKRSIILLICLIFVLIYMFVIPSFTNYWFIIYVIPLLIFAFMLFIIFEAFPWSKLNLEFDEDRIGSSKNIIEIIALLSAGFFFLFHFVANLDITNMDLEATTKRQKVHGTDSTYLAVDLKLSKGSVASTNLHSIKAYIYNIDSTKAVDSILFQGYSRVLIFPEETYLSKSATTYTTFSDIIDRTEPYTMAANESTHFSACKLMKDNEPYRVEIIVITRRKKLLHKVNSQFRASVISLPYLDGN